MNIILQIINVLCNVVVATSLFFMLLELIEIRRQLQK